MPWEVRITTELVHSGSDEAIGHVYLADGSLLRVVTREGHNGQHVILHPDHVPEPVAALMDTVHERLEAQRAEIIENIEAGLWTGEFDAEGNIKFPPYERSRIQAVVVSPLRVGISSVVIAIGGYGEPRSAQYVFDSPVTKLIGND